MRAPLACLLLLMAVPARAQDRDGDRIPDASDLCPDAAERGASAFPGDGCPDTDADRDGIVDDYDACPASLEIANGYRDLDGCRDARPTGPPTAIASSGPDLTRIGCFEGGMLFDVASNESGQARLVPRADAPTWLGTATLDCYAGATHEGRRAVHCASADATVEVLLAFRTESTHAIGFAAIRTARGTDYRAWSGTAQPAWDRTAFTTLLDARGDAIQGCYEQEHGAERALAGRVTVAVRVATSGEVEDVRVTADTIAPSTPAIAACLVGIVDALVVATPPHCGPVSFTVPFVFELEPPAAGGS